MELSAEVELPFEPHQVGLDRRTDVGELFQMELLEFRELLDVFLEGVDHPGPQTFDDNSFTVIEGA